MLNHIVLMGRLTRDPELRQTQSGLPVCTFSIACQRDFKSADGEKAVDYIDIVAWRGTAEFVNNYFTKGRMAVVDGRLQLRDWTDRDGNNRRSAEVVASRTSPPRHRRMRTSAPRRDRAGRTPGNPMTGICRSERDQAGGLGSQRH